MSAISMPIPITRTRRRTMRLGRSLGACFSCSRRFLDLPYLLGNEFCAACRAAVADPYEAHRVSDSPNSAEVIAARKSVHNGDGRVGSAAAIRPRSEEHTSELQSLRHLVCRLLLEKK